MCTYEMKTRRLYIRPMEIEDCVELIQVYGDEDVMLGNAMDAPLTHVDDMMAYLQEMIQTRQRLHLPPVYVLERLDSGFVIGTIQFSHFYQNNAELGFLLSKSHWNQGYMSEAVQAMIENGFQRYGLHRIEIQYDPQNIACAHVCQKNGFVKEGTLRSVLRLNDERYHDLVICSILKEEYEQRRESI